MSKYYCSCCDYQAKQKSNYEKHILTKKHIKNYEKVNIESTISQQLVNNFTTFENDFFNDDDTISEMSESICDKTFSCKYCCRGFTTKQAMYRHIKYTCRYNKDEDLKEYVRLLNEQLKEQKQINKNLQKQMDKLSNKLQINVITNNQQINNNIKLLNYKETDTSHLTIKDYVQAIKQINYSIPTIVEKVHYNPEKPENMNIYISSMKDKYVMIFQDGTWQLKDRNSEIENILDEKYFMLREWLDGNNQYENLKKYIEKMDSNMENQTISTMIKDQIKMKLYNNRNLVKGNYKNITNDNENIEEKAIQKLLENSNSESENDDEL